LFSISLSNYAVLNAQVALNSSPVVTMTQAIRVSLLARVTIAFAFPLRITSALNQRLSASVLSGVYFETALAP